MIRREGVEPVEALAEKSKAEGAPQSAENVPGKRAARVGRLTLSALLLACAVVLSFLEGLLPAPPAFLPPGVKLGLANIPVMYALLFVGKRDAFGLMTLKSLFVLATRGPAAGFLSLCGGLCALLVMLLLIALFHDRVSVFLLSISGAVFHNLGQLTGVSLLYGTFFWFYIPLMLPAGIATGALTALLLRFISPVFKRLGV